MALQSKKTKFSLGPFELKRSALSHKILFAVSHITYLLYCIWLGPWYLALSLVTGLLCYNLAAQLFMHRSVAHGHFDFGPLTKKVLCCLFSFCNFGSIAANACMHAHHHKYSDSASDPHNFRQIGITNVVVKNWKFTLLLRDLKKFLKHTELLSQHKTNIRYAMASSLLIPFVPVCAFWLVNILFIILHAGKSPGPINLPILYPLTWGEELHLDHHYQPGKKKLHQFDLMYLIGNELEKVNV